MRLVGFMRTWNEKDIIAEVIQRNLQQLDDLIVIDKGSTDGTWDILRSLNLKYLYRIEIKESREMEDRRIGFRMAWMLQPDWVIQIDSDEILWSFRASVRDTLAAIPACYDSVSIQLVDFFWNKAHPEPFVYNGHPSIFENRRYVCAGHRWMLRISRPLPYLDYTASLINAKNCLYLKDFIFRHYTMSVNPERAREKRQRYIDTRSEFERDGQDMSWVDRMAATDYFNMNPSMLMDFEPVKHNRELLQSWEQWVVPRAKWLCEAAGENPNEQHSRAAAAA